MRRSYPLRSPRVVTPCSTCHTSPSSHLVPFTPPFRLWSRSIETVFPSARALVGPGFGCSVLFFLTFIMTQVQCCYMGCCCRNPEKSGGDVKMTNIGGA